MRSYWKPSESMSSVSVRVMVASRGLALVEVVTVISLVSVILVLFSTLILRMGQVQRKVEAQRVQHLRWDELRVRVRDDLHVAQNCRIQGNAVRLLAFTALPNGGEAYTITDYVALPDRLMRVVWSSPLPPPPDRVANADANANASPATLAPPVPGAVVQSRWDLPFTDGMTAHWSQAPWPAESSTGLVALELRQAVAMPRGVANASLTPTASSTGPPAVVRCRIEAQLGKTASPGPSEEPQP